MKVIYYLGIRDFDAWDEALNVKNRIIEEGKADMFDSFMDDLYPEGISAGDLNDFLWFSKDNIYNWLGMDTED